MIIIYIYTNNNFQFDEKALTLMIAFSYSKLTSFTSKTEKKIMPCKKAILISNCR